MSAPITKDRHFGVDFDNTIAVYDDVFHRWAVRLFRMPPEVHGDKHSIRRYFWAYKGGRRDWIELQGIVYGTKMAEATIAPGLAQFLARCRALGIPVSVVSHKTEYPALGPRVSLHEAAWQWLEANRFFEPDGFSLARSNVFFETERERKLARIVSLQCTAFVDDLPEVFLDPAFPDNVQRLLYDPAGCHPPIPAVTACSSWEQVTNVLFLEEL